MSKSTGFTATFLVQLRVVGSPDISYINSMLLLSKHMLGHCGIRLGAVEELELFHLNGTP